MTTRITTRPTKLLILFLTSMLAVGCSLESDRSPSDLGLDHTPKNPFHDNLGPAPVKGSFRMEGYITWGASVIRGDDDRYYMFVSRWPEHMGYRNWVTNAEIVLASSNVPEGPYQFEKVVLPPRGREYWDGMMTRIPVIRRHDGKYILFYVGTTYDFERPTTQVTPEEYGTAWNRKRIGVAVADSPQGPWQRQDQPILEPRPGKWDGAITSNPAPIIHDDGSVLLIYKSAPVPYPERRKIRDLDFGVAVAPHFLGPYRRVNAGQKIEFKGMPRARVEDPCIWYREGFYHMVAKIFGDEITGETQAGFYAFSQDGMEWALPKRPQAYSRRVLFSDGTERVQSKLEQPQVLLQDGIPSHVFFATADPEMTKLYNLVMPLKNPGAGLPGSTAKPSPSTGND
jgi:hypothetical protein